ncbi:hypothetical protein C8R43DRAFT_1162588 [Mycena crocata]|nr:hypothetical protein C8R43DRAFT_1162588 [Mycena crocata]
MNLSFREEFSESEKLMGCQKKENELVEIELLKTQLEIVTAECRRLIDLNSTHEENHRALEKCIAEEKLARAQDDVMSKLKIDTLLVENSRLNKAINQEDAFGQAVPQGKGLKRRRTITDANYTPYVFGDYPQLRVVHNLTTEQKQGLAKAIAKLDGRRLDMVIQMISKVVPEIKDVETAMEIDIDMIPPGVQIKLYEFVFNVGM